MSDITMSDAAYDHHDDVLGRRFLLMVLWKLILTDLVRNHLQLNSMISTMKRTSSIPMNMEVHIMSILMKVLNNVG